MGTEAGLAPSTTLLYANYVHALLHDHASATQLIDDPARFAQTVAEYDSHLLSGSRNVFRSAARMFARYAFARRGVTIPLDFRAKRPASVLGPFLRVLETHHVPFGRLELIRWRDVRRNGNKGELTDELCGEYYLVPIETVQALSLWAGGGERASQDQPFIPIEPKSFTPMGTKRLLRLARGP